MTLADETTNQPLQVVADEAKEKDVLLSDSQTIATALLVRDFACFIYSAGRIAVLAPPFQPLSMNRFTPTP